MEKEIYLDNSATTPCSERALARYMEISRLHYGNPSSLHHRGKDAEDIVKAARKAVLSSIGARDGSVVFTSGGTESNNLALFGRAYAKERYRGCRILTTAGEHASVNAPLEKLKKEGFDVVYIPTVGGTIDLAALEAAATRNVILASFMLVNNETGAYYDLGAARAILNQKCPDAILHSDATQAYGKLPINVQALGIDMLTVSSHKIEGPKGVGALWISSRLIKEKGVSPQTLGGGQENGMRSGTVNVPGIGAFATAAEDCRRDLTKNISHLSSLREYALAQLSVHCPEIRPNLPVRPSPHILNITLPSIKSETMLQYLSGMGIYISSGSACSSHGTRVSLALSSFGISDAEADTSVRISFGTQNTKDDIDTLVRALATGCQTLARIR